MTHDEMIAVIAAHRDGKKIQCKSRCYTNEEWNNLPSGPSWEFHSNDYRVAPEPKLRPWKPEEVPMPCVVRDIEDNRYRWMALSASPHGVVVVGSGGEQQKAVSFFDLLRRCEHSTDGGVTWLPCGVMEGEG